MRFEFATATRIIFGPGTLREAGPVTLGFGRRAFIVTGRDVRRAEPLVEILRRSDVESVCFSVAGEPTIEVVNAGVERARSEACDVIIGLGGGSAIDAGKAIAAMLTNGGDLMDYLEVIGRAQPLKQAPTPFIAIPTTAGAGAEVTRNAVITARSHRVKVSLRSPLMLPRVALVDPELTFGLPPSVTASTGLDALTQLIEPYVCSRANPMTDALCVDGIRRVARSLRRAVASGHDAAAREDMSLASLFGGLALANAGLGAVHGFAAPIGGMFPAPHGAVCAALLPRVMRVNLEALQQRDPENPARSRYQEAAALLTGDPGATAGAGVEWVRQLVHDLNIPGLGAYGIGREHVEDLCQKASVASSMKANPLPLTNEELASILRDSLNR